MVKRIFVTYHLQCEPDQHETVQRVLDIHADYCPVARTIRGCVDIQTSVEFVT